MPAPTRRPAPWLLVSVLAAVVLAVAIGGPHAGAWHADRDSRTVATVAHVGTPDATRPAELRHPSTPTVVPQHLDLATAPSTVDVTPALVVVPTSTGTPVAVQPSTTAPHPGRAPPAA